MAQIAFVVRDIESARKRFAELLGRPLPDVISTDPGEQVRQTYRGRPSKARAKLAFLDLGNSVQLELIEPIGEDSAWFEGLAKQGEGFHHIAFWVEGMGRFVEFLGSQGVPMIQRGDMGGGQYAYFDATEKLGVMLELLERDRTQVGG